MQEVNTNHRVIQQEEVTLLINAETNVIQLRIKEDALAGDIAVVGFTSIDNFSSFAVELLEGQHTPTDDDGDMLIKTEVDGG